MKSLFALILLVMLISCEKDYSYLEVDTYGHAGEGIRNGRNKYPPNSLEGLKYIFDETEVEGVEIDVQMTLDSQLVVWHDLTLDENSTGIGCVPSQNWSELSTVKIYKTNYKIPTLKEALDLIFSYDRQVYLDLKYFNECDGLNVDFNTFSNALEIILQDYSSSQKENIIVNARNLELINTISDTMIVKSYETDTFENIVNGLLMNNVDVLTTRLSSMNTDLKTELDLANIDVCLYEVFVRSEVLDALAFSPKMLIADKINCALKFTHGKE